MRRESRRSASGVALAGCVLLLGAACSGGEASRSDSVNGTSLTSDSANGMITSAAAPAAGMTDQDMASFLAVTEQSAVDAGRLASARARRADVRALADTIVTGHGAALQQLRQLAALNEWSIIADSETAAATTAPRIDGADRTVGRAGGTSGSLSGTVSTQDSAGAIGVSADTTSRGALAATVAQLELTQRDRLARLRSIPRAAFDSAYIDAQRRAHEQTLQLLRQYGPSVQSADLRAHVQTAQTAIERHLQRIDEARIK